MKKERGDDKYHLELCQENLKSKYLSYHTKSMHYRTIVNLTCMYTAYEKDFSQCKRRTENSWI